MPLSRTLYPPLQVEVGRKVRPARWVAVGMTGAHDRRLCGPNFSEGHLLWPHDTLPLRGLEVRRQIGPVSVAERGKVDSEEHLGTE